MADEMAIGPATTEAEPEPAAASILLPADLDYPAALELHAHLLDAVGAESVILDAAAVERVSTAAILVIASFLASREAIEPPAVVVGASGAFTDAFSDLGLFAILMRMEFRA